jgi:hypothetical protein
MWFKKNHENRFGEPSISRLASFRPKPGNDTIPVSTKMSHLWCYFQLFFIHNSTFIIHHSTFIIRHFIIRQFDSSTFHHSTFIILNFRKSTDLPPIKSSVANYVAMCAMWFKKIHHLTVLANPQFPDWRQFGQNPETIRFLYLQRCRTSGAIFSYSTFIIRYSSFIIHYSTIRRFIVRQFDNYTIRHFIIRHSSF